ncbi:translation initiation factor IF-2-like isoform X2 [Tyto alba]|uniref:translation initiation factor IF-2-like isoform X2 n=1 Tax=Tyto alba TaxID=56313 RepID=UPI001C67F274|nr:translation initiation factor IF-2-like isoform X2 [Tyto alba]
MPRVLSDSSCSRRQSWHRHTPQTQEMPARDLSNGRLETQLPSRGGTRSLEHSRLFRVPGRSLQVIRKEPKRNERLENSAMPGRCLAVRFFTGWLRSHKPLLGSTQPVPTASLSQKGGRQAFSPSPPPPPRVPPALRRAGARRLSAAAWAPWGALGADTPFARPTAASPSSSCSLGCAGRARGLRLERQRAQPVVGTAQRNTNGRGLSALPRVTPPWERRAPGTKLSPSAGKQPRSLPASSRLPAPPLPVGLVPAVGAFHRRLPQRLHWGQVAHGGCLGQLVPTLRLELMAVAAPGGQGTLLHPLAPAPAPPPAPQEPPDPPHGPAGMGTAPPLLASPRGAVPGRTWRALPGAGCQQRSRAPRSGSSRAAASGLSQRPQHWHQLYHQHRWHQLYHQHQRHQYQQHVQYQPAAQHKQHSTSTAPAHSQHRQALCGQVTAGNQGLGNECADVMKGSVTSDGAGGWAGPGQRLAGQRGLCAQNLSAHTQAPWPRETAPGALCPGAQGCPRPPLRGSHLPARSADPPASSPLPAPPQRSPGRAPTARNRLGGSRLGFPPAGPAPGDGGQQPGPENKGFASGKPWQVQPPDENVASWLWNLSGALVLRA